MTEMGQDILSLAAMTTAVGMGVVFAALVLLACYMIIFKRLTTHLEEKGRRAAAPPEAKAQEAPQISSAATVDTPAAEPTMLEADPVEAELAVAMAAAQVIGNHFVG